MGKNWHIYNKDSRSMDELEDESVHLVVTSPPYPMFDMWDKLFANLNCPNFDEQHKMLFQVWRECYRALVDGGLMCINITDLAISVNGVYQLFNNHSLTVQFCRSLRMYELPYILWHKIMTSTKTKFVGSGMLPPNAYICPEIEFILIFRKGTIRQFPPKDANRQESRYTYMQRNQWFSQIWDIPGVNQLYDGKRLGVFPPEIPYRLIRMFSLKGETVLDPFAGTGTTIREAIGAGRQGIGYEINPEVYQIALEMMCQKSLSYVSEDVEIIPNKKGKSFRKPIANKRLNI